MLDERGVLGVGFLGTPQGEAYDNKRIQCMRSNAMRVPHQGNHNRATSKPDRSVATTSGESIHPKRSRAEKRALFYGLCSEAEAAILAMDKGTRYEKGSPITHQLGGDTGLTFEGYLRPFSYLDHLKQQDDVRFSALGQLGYEYFHPLYNADDYAEAMAKVQETTEIA
jgi:hypothetical protein